LLVVELQSGKVLSDIPWAGGEALWSADGNGLIFRQSSGRVSNLFRISPTGGEPKPLTNFKDGFIGTFGSTADGKLVMTRGSARSDAVMIRGLR